MVASLKAPLVAAEEYLRTEALSEVKREFARGKILAMAGASDRHVLITGNAYALLKNHLRGRGCLTFFTETKIRFDATDFYYYPDVFVTCDPRDRNFKDGKRFPKLIVEVLSPSTAGRDRGEKFADYRQIETLQEYILIEQDSLQIEVFRRNADNRWELYPFTEGEIVAFASIDFKAAIEQFYEDILFDN
jgi:Uma2 family endonuclease